MNEETTEEQKKKEEIDEMEEQIKCGRKQRKAEMVPQVIDGGGVEVGPPEMRGRCQPSPLRKKIKVSKSMYLVDVLF